MKGKLSFVTVLVVLCTLLSTGSDGQARAQQEPDRSLELERLFDLTSYQGLEETPRFESIAPAPEILSPEITQIGVPYSQIVFQSFRNLDNWNIFLADGSGGNHTQLTWGSSADIHPRLNRGCTTIVFSSNSSGNYEIYTVNLDGSGLSRLTQSKKDDVYPAWSQDGTQIVFQSYRDSNPEIYTMQPDGSNQTRLTSYTGYDGTPSWTPDGRIVFTSDQAGTSGIWVMNSDGSGATQLASQPYSIYPAWSTDGSQVAYSADGDGNGFLELWLMNSDGTNPHMVFNPGPNSEAWVRSWSPGGQYIAYTNINLTYYHGNWYWVQAWLDAWDVSTDTSARISVEDTEWYPDWQSTDSMLPISDMSALTAISPASFTVSWSGFDVGPSGLKNFDVQVRDGAEGNWTNWQMATAATSSVYTGIGGHTYYFRTRAQDIAGNFEAWPPDFDVSTTVETLPPNTSVKPLPAYLRNGSTVEWGGTDPGGSGVKTYDVQYRDTQVGVWKNWLTGTTNTNAVFNGTSGHTYQFRAQGTDEAMNVESWPSGDGDTSTTIYTWGILGTSWDNTGVPVTGLAISTQPEARASIPSDSEGNFAAYVVTDVSTYTVNWQKDGYGGFPVTAYGKASDAHKDMIMPPLDNLVQDWGFESGAFGTAWNADGAIPPTFSEAQHTGQYAALLGQSFNFLPEEPVTLTNMLESRSDMAVDSAGGVHIVWSEADGGLSRVYYAHRNMDGYWDIPRQEISGPEGGASPQIAVDRTQTAHVVWTSNNEIEYTLNSSGGSWSTPINLTNNTTLDSEPLIRVGPDGVTHVLWWQGDRNTMYTLGYVQKVNSTWSNIYVIPLSEHLNEGQLHFIVGDNNTVHVLYAGTKCQYTHREPDGTWIYPEPLPNTSNCSMSSEVHLAVDHNGGVYAIWLGGYPENEYVYYAKRGPNGWPEREIIVGAASNSLALTLDPSGIPYLTWCQGNTYYLTSRKADSTWRDPESIPYISCANRIMGTLIHLQFANQNTLYLAWALDGVHFMYHKLGGSWTVPWEYLMGMPTIFDLAIEDSQKVHMLWNDPWKLNYGGPPSAEQTGESTISQAIHVPITLTAPTLSFLYNLGGWSTSARNGFKMTLNDGLSTTELLYSYEASTSWQHAWFDLTPWLSQTITLTFQADQTAGYDPLWAYLDEVTVGSAHPDVWVSTFGPQAAMPGDTVTLQLCYGNRSPVADAVSATITATLPAGLIFDSASLTPTVSGNILTWTMDDLPAGGGPFTILVTVTLAGDALLGNTLTLPVEIASTTPELELMNNQEAYELYIGNMVFLPLLQR
jgi:uncharacterized repeat protein (TIGR01451 family)